MSSEATIQTAKRVSFSDGLSTHPESRYRQNSPKDVQVDFQGDHRGSFCLPLEHSQHKANRYLESLHQSQDCHFVGKDSNKCAAFDWPESSAYLHQTSTKYGSRFLDIDQPISSHAEHPTVFEKIDETSVENSRHDEQQQNNPHYSLMEVEARRDKLRWILISECSILLGDGKHSRESFQKIFTQPEFLQIFFRLFDLDGDSSLSHDKWVEHMKCRLTDGRKIEFAEQLESIAYIICGEGNITYGDFRQIWCAPVVLDQLYRLIELDSSNQISTNDILNFIAHLTNTRPQTGFDKCSLEQLELIFKRTVGNEKEIHREEFKNIVISKNPFFTERVFQIFDKDNSGTISLQEFIDAMHQFAGKSTEDKIKFLFKVYDIDGDGLIQHLELQHVIRACMEENGMQFSEEQVEDLTIALFEDADPMRRGAITYEALKSQLEKHDGLLENLSISIDRWLVPIRQEPRKTASLMPHQLTMAYFKNNYVYLFYLAVYFIINFGLFVSRAIQYSHSNGFVIIARACGQCLNFNCAWILVLMLRQCITFLRSRGFSTVLPLDHHIYLHKLTGVTIAIYSLIHTIMHFLNFSIVVVNDSKINAANYSLSEWLFTARPGLFGLIQGLANPTGTVLFIILLIMFICSQPFVRRKGSFEIFYWTHLLYLPYWILLIFHGPNFWKWFIVPGLMFAVERILRFVWMKSEYGKTYISSGLLLPSHVTHLVIKRPSHFYFRPGDYVFVNIPAIATYEWHPFTISSAPEQEDYMWLHIRGVGEWTISLYDYFEKEHDRLHKREVTPFWHSEHPTLKKDCERQNNLLQNNPSHNVKAASLDSNAAGKISVSAEKYEDSKPESLKEALQHYPGTSKTNMESFETEKQKHEMQHSIKNIKASLRRTFSKKNTREKTGAINCGFESYSDDRNSKLNTKLSLEKSPLEKSLSLPDIHNRVKKRERLIALREYNRSESEQTFDEGEMLKAKVHALGTAYLSPQNKSLAHSFRYMRNKPTIIAFKTPSLENWEYEKKSQSKIVTTDIYTEHEAEEGTILDKNASAQSQSSEQYGLDFPVGRPLEIFIDGPYGAPSSHIFAAQHAVLIATGIGVTPFASILQSIMHRYWKARHSCPKCHFEWASEIPKSIMNLRKVDFFWINRDQRSFEWFVNLLSQLEIEQAELGGALERFLDMHMFITSALQKTDMKAVGLQLALDLLHEKEKRDLITGLKTRTNAGRPNWDKVFKQIAAQKKGKVTVFYCGPLQLGKTLRYKCDQFGFAFRKENF